MEAKLAEFRQRKIKEQTSRSTRQKIAELFAWTRSSTAETNHNSTSGMASTIPIDPSEVSTDGKQSTKATTKGYKKSHDDELYEEEEVEDVPTAPWSKYDWLLLILKVLLWLIAWKVFIELQFGAVFFALSALVFIYFNTRSGHRNRRGLSAYSVFNPNCERIEGTITAEQLEANLLYRKLPTTQ